VSNYYRDDAVLLKFGQRVRAHRVKLGMSLREFAYQCDMDFSQIRKIEKGELNTSISHVFLIARNLGISPEELIRDIAASI
jgi:transcriptional regulator with XRE-family HTH domain